MLAQLSNGQASLALLNDQSVSATTGNNNAATYPENRLGDLRLLLEGVKDGNDLLHIPPSTKSVSNGQSGKK